jgi:ribonuclease HI
MKRITQFFNKIQHPADPPITPKKQMHNYVFTDGACFHNGKKNAIAGIGVFFGINDPRNISRRVQGKQSNNTAELTAMIEAVRIIQPELGDKSYIVVSDSIYAIRCATDYGKSNAKTGWKKDIPNKELVKILYELVSPYPESVLQLKHIMSHTGSQDPLSIGNDYADKLASASLLPIDRPR